MFYVQLVLLCFTLNMLSIKCSKSSVPLFFLLDLSFYECLNEDYHFVYACRRACEFYTFID